MVSFQELVDWSRRGELGYWIAADHQGNGYATDAVRTLVASGFRDLGLNRIKAKVFDGNEASRSILETLGFTHEGVHRAATFVDGQFCVVHWYGVLATEWDDD